MGNLIGPKCSVCIPVYNCEKFVGSAIESVLSQTFKEYELVILNNHSTDGTSEVISRYKDPRIRVINNERTLNVDDNWSKLLSEANGEYIKLLCADDSLRPSCLERQVSVLDDPLNKNVVLTCCGREIINEKGRVLYRMSLRGLKGKLSGLNAIKKIVRAGINLIGEPSAVLFRAAILKNAGRFDGSNPFIIDLDMWSRMLLYGDLYVIPEYLSTYRISPSQWSVSIARTQSRDFKRLISKLYIDPRYGLNRFDCIKGKIMADINALQRHMFYKVFLGSGKSS